MRELTQRRQNKEINKRAKINKIRRQERHGKQEVNKHMARHLNWLVIKNEKTIFHIYNIYNEKVW